jgi:predicted O-methyltransferase YrrM
MAFIDADKPNYLNYYERCLQLVRAGGLLLFDNTLWGGAVADPRDREPDTLAIRELNDALHRDERVSISLVPIGDGLTLARKR